MRSQDIGAIPLTADINCNYGTNAVFVALPDSDRRNLIIYAQTGSVAIRAGDQATAMAGVTENPGADITNGSSHLTINEGGVMVFLAPEGVTLKGFTATSAAIYWWV